ncbi:polyphosphate kinase 1 [bacterium]|nr:polyphosphate kinase 1 [bacterium]
MAAKAKQKITVDSPQAYLNRELSWLAFARRVLAQVEDKRLPLLERVKFAGIMGMLHDEFFQKRIGGLKRTLLKGVEKTSPDGRTPIEELMACRSEILDQINVLSRVIKDEIRPALAEAKIPILEYDKLSKKQVAALRDYFTESILPVVTPLAVDASHPFPFISSLGLNLAVQIRDEKKSSWRFVRIKVPDNRPRWVPLSGSSGYVPLERVIAANLDRLFPEAAGTRCFLFRVTRGMEGTAREPADLGDPNAALVPGSLISQVTGELKARRFAGVVRLQVESDMPEKLQNWIAEQLAIETEDIYSIDGLLGINDLLSFHPEGQDELRDPRLVQATPPQLAGVDPADPAAIFDAIRAGDILLHHPYDSFDTSVLRFIRSAALDRHVLAIKLTIYRTSSDSPIVQALAEAARRGKQVAVLVEITARFDEAPNIAWGAMLENEGVHVAYGVEQLKTHVKLALVVREEGDRIRRYAHVGTGNYHSKTARIYEDLGLLTCDPDICADAAAVLNELTGAIGLGEYRKLLVAPRTMRQRFVELIRNEAKNAKAGKPSGIRAKMNQLQDPEIIRELYAASQAGVPIALNVRGLCCLRPGLPGLSQNIRVFGVIGRFLEHSRIYRFENAGQPKYFIGSADWMRRNLDRRVETITPVMDPRLQEQLAAILDTYDSDNCSAWDAQPDGTYVQRQPCDGELCRAAQKMFIRTVEQTAPRLN